eukprot:scpid88778/ scgid5939/ 
MPVEEHFHDRLDSNIQCMNKKKMGAGCTDMTERAQHLFHLLQGACYKHTGTVTVKNKQEVTLYTIPGATNMFLMAQELVGLSICSQSPQYVSRIVPSSDSSTFFECRSLHTKPDACKLDRATTS